MVDGQNRIVLGGSAWPPTELRPEPSDFLLVRMLAV